MSARRRRRRNREPGGTDLEIMPMLNVFLAIIPLLLLSAAFTPVSIIPASLPADAAGDAAAEPAEEPLDLAVHILPERYVIQARGLAPRSVDRPRADRDDPAAKQSRERLAALLAELAAAHPNQHDVRIVSRPGTRYEEIVDAMDAARGAGFSDSALCEATAGGS